MAAILKRVFHHNVDVPIRFLWTQKEPWYQAKSIALFLGISNLPRALSMCPPDSAKTLYELSLIYGGPSRYGRTIPPQTFFINDAGVESFTNYNQRVPIITTRVPWLLNELIPLAHKPILPGDPDIITADSLYYNKNCRLRLTKADLEKRLYGMGEDISKLQDILADMRVELDVVKNAPELQNIYLEFAEMRTDMEALRAELGKTKDALRTLAQLVAPILDKHN